MEPSKTRSRSPGSPPINATNTEALQPPVAPAAHRHPSPADSVASAAMSERLPRGAAAGSRSTSKGGIQGGIDETGGWSNVRDKGATMTAETQQGLKKGEKPSGMLGFLSRNKGRARSPKPREPGVLGKEGARVVISR